MLQSCRFFFLDYIDFDVYLNARIFYRLAGYSIRNSGDLSECDLLVLFRGLPVRIYPEYSGPIHFYDYVCEHNIDIRHYFPNSTSITVISIAPHKNLSSTLSCVPAYLPVIPSLWQFSLPLIPRSSLPIHISNHKPLKNDVYQQEIISLALVGKLSIYGSKWERVNIKARPLSYLSANIKLSLSSVCYGLMYPYQRGRSLSGRMWQGPLQGCMVLSEPNTNVYGCPGVFETSSFANAFETTNINPHEIAREATDFWWKKTQFLAVNLGLKLDFNRLPVEIIHCRYLLFEQHCRFTLDAYLFPLFLRVRKKIKSLLPL